jgi:asparagine synthase (glutamine-hydrolysing)
MSGIVGIQDKDATGAVTAMLNRIKHRGPDGSRVAGLASGVFGAVSLAPRPFDEAGPFVRNKRMIAWDGELYDFEALREGSGSETSTDLEWILERYDQEGPAVFARLNGPFAVALLDGDDLVLARDPLGQAPLYTGTADGQVCFASEIKALEESADDIRAFPPGRFLWRGELKPIPEPAAPPPMDADPDRIAAELLRRLERSVERRLAHTPKIGVWLSGGLDSSALTALAAAGGPPVSTFSAGIQGAPDLTFAREVASFLHTDHHERLCTVDEMLEILPRVIYHLESFDAPLVRSSIANYLVAGAAAGTVRVVLSGEGGDELFAGYSFLKDKTGDSLRAALAEAQGALHNTALQRVDRMAAAHGTRARPGYLDPDVVAFANAMPAAVKLHGPEQIEKWVLRRAIQGRLPEEVVWRPKEKFWSGSGISDKLAEVADREISDDAFAREREVAPGDALSSKEDLFYYRIFRRWFPRANVLGSVGRTVHRESR